MPPASWASPSPLLAPADSSLRSFLSFLTSNRHQCALRIPIHRVAASLLRPSSPPCTPPPPLRPQAGTGSSDNSSPGQQGGPLTRARQALRRPGGPRAGGKRPRSGVGTWPAAEPRDPKPRPLRAAAPAPLYLFLTFSYDIYIYCYFILKCFKFIENLQKQYEN